MQEMKFEKVRMKECKVEGIISLDRKYMNYEENNGMERIGENEPAYCVSVECAKD